MLDAEGLPDDPARACDLPARKDALTRAGDGWLANALATSREDGAQPAPLHPHRRLLPTHGRPAWLQLLELEECRGELMGGERHRQQERRRHEEARERPDTADERAHGVDFGTTMSNSARSCCRRSASHSSATLCRKRCSTLSRISSNGGRLASWRSWTQTRW